MINFYTGGEEYYLLYKNGTHEVRRVTSFEGDYDVVFIGNYNSCLEFLDTLVESNFEYDLNL